MVEKISPFAWIDAVTQKKTDPMSEYGEKEYPSFMVNRGLSYFADCVMYASEINQYPHLDKKLQYDYYRSALRPARRITKWGKKKSDPNVAVIMEYYNYNREKAEAAAKILTDDQVASLKESMERGRDN